MLWHIVWLLFGEHCEKIMIKNYFKIAIRNLLKNKMFSFVNIFGFSIGLASAILIITFIWHELSYDTFYPDVDNTYRVYCDQPGNLYMNSTKFNVMPIPFQPEVKNRFPEVDFASRLEQSSHLYSLDGENYTSEDTYMVDQDFLQMFDVQMVFGARENALKDDFSALLSLRTSQKYFGDINPVGKVLYLNDTTRLVVKGVFKDFSTNTHFSCRVILPYAIDKMRRSENNLKSWTDHNVQMYINLADGVSKKDFEKKLEELVIEKRGEDIKDRYYLQNVQKIHLYGKLNFELSSNGDIKYIYIFGAIALFILLIASFNYMNLATARSMKRAKEVGLRKVIGATRQQLFKQFVGESLVFIFFSFLISLILIEIFEPYFNEFVNRDIHFYQLSYEFYIIILAVILFIAFVSGSYPALYLSRFSPIKVLNNKVKGSLRTVLIRNSMVILQFFISIVLLICTIVVIKQLVFIKNKNLGFTTQNIISVRLTSQEQRDKIDFLKNELRTIPSVKDLTSSNYLPSSITSSTTIRHNTDDGEKRLLSYIIRVDNNFLEFYDMKLLDGESFNQDNLSGDYVILNKEAEKAFGVGRITGEEIRFGWPERKSYKVLGVVENFHFASLNQEIKPVTMVLNNKNNGRFSIKIAPDNQDETLSLIEEKLSFVPSKRPFTYHFVTDLIDRTYREEQRLSSLFTFFTIIAVVIACLGLFGLISFITDQRTKEIGIRKVLGASVQNILVMLSKNITKWILLANIIAWPVAWYFMDQWLQNFQYHIKLDVLIFALVGVLSLLIGLLTVGVQAIKAALLNPVETLKYE